MNFPTHAHGQGYSDVNWLLPELVSFVRVQEGLRISPTRATSRPPARTISSTATRSPPRSSSPAARTGSAASCSRARPSSARAPCSTAWRRTTTTAPSNAPTTTAGSTGCCATAAPAKTDDFNVTLLGYDGHWSSSDQIPQRFVDQGAIDRYGLIDPSDGGGTYRYALSTQFEHRSGNTTTKFSAYAIRYSLDLFSDFTYALDDATDYFNVTANPVTCKSVYSTCAPAANHVAGYTAFCPANAAPPAPGGAPQPFAFACGDQREQQDRRFVTGFRLARTWQTATASNTLGLGLRNDNIANVALFLDTARSRTPDGTLTNDHVVEREVNAYLQTEQRLGPKLRLTAGVRGELYRFDVHAFDPVNSGVRTAGLVLPKLSFAYRASPSGEFYLSAGESFHSNDGRGTTVTVDPQTHATIDPTGAAVERVSPLVRANGEEIGYRYASPKLNTTLSLWRLGIASELTFSGDAGTTSAGRPTVRKGIELTNFYTPTRNLTYRRRFRDLHRRASPPIRAGSEPAFPRRSASVAALGVTLDRSAYAASLRLRYFGPRNLIEDGSESTRPTTLLNGRVTREAGARPAYRPRRLQHPGRTRRRHDLLLQFVDETRRGAIPRSPRTRR